MRKIRVAPVLLALSLVANVAFVYALLDQSVALTHHQDQIALRDAQVADMEAVLPVLLRHASPADLRAVADENGIERWEKTDRQTVVGGVSFDFEDGELRQLSFD